MLVVDVEVGLFNFQVIEELVEVLVLFLRWI